MLTIKFAQILSLTFHAFNLSSWCHCWSFSRSQDQNSSMNNKWIQRRKCGILTSSGWATIWATKIKNLHTLSRQWAAVNSEFCPTSSSFEAPSFTEWLPGSWVNFHYHLGMISECASTLVLPQNTLASLIYLHQIRQFTASKKREMAWEKRGEE